MSAPGMLSVHYILRVNNADVDAGSFQVPTDGFLLQSLKDKIKEESPVWPEKIKSIFVYGPLEKKQLKEANLHMGSESQVNPDDTIEKLRAEVDGTPYFVFHVEEKQTPQPAPPNPPAYDFQQLHQFLSVAPEILREMGISRRTRLDPWERESLRTTGSKRSAKFRSKIIRYYDRMSQTGKSVKCQVLDEDVAVSAATNNNTGIIAAHIWKASTLGHGLEEFGLQPSDVNNPRNGLFLTKGLEVAFDRKQICFLYNHIDHKLILWVADTSLMLEVIVGSGRNQTFSDVHQKPLICPHGKLPYRRLLSWHARLTLDQCRQTIDTTRYVSEYDNSPGRQNTVVDPFTRAIQAMVGPGDDASTLDDEMQS